jgi:hypothetical protein
MADPADCIEHVTDPIIELLAMKLYEHDLESGWPPAKGVSLTPWNFMSNEDRESYRRIARGEEELGYAPEAPNA